ncbi:g9237 [Coccomyxa elongata]
MGRSLRRAKKTRPKLTVKGKKKPRIKAKVPLEITSQRPSMGNKLGVEPQWDREKPLTSNYASNQVLLDPNAGFGRNAKPDIIQEGEEINSEVESDDDLRALEGKCRRSGPAPLQKLTTHQRQIVERLKAAHGDNLEAMARDKKLNSMLMTAGKLRRLMAAYEARKDRGRCGFRVPNKRLW